MGCGHGRVGRVWSWEGGEGEGGEGDGVQGEKWSFLTDI